MKLYEYQAKAFFREYGIPVPRGILVSTPGEAFRAAEELGRVVVKAQVLVGGRGKAGGIAIADNPLEAEKAASRILGMSIKGLRVEKVLVEERKEIERELYVGVAIDRAARRPVVMVSPLGGIDIEETARKAPEKIYKAWVDPLLGLQDYQARNLAFKIAKAQRDSVASIIKNLYRLFLGFDCTLAEINPLAIAGDGNPWALDAKMVIDDNALFRQPRIAPLANQELGPLEIEAKQSGMSYVALDGNIGCIANGAGLSMATLDLIKSFRGEPANFLDVRAGATAPQIEKALRIVTSNKNVKAILVNIFGGLTRCDEIAMGISKILPEVILPLVVRLSGTREEEGKRILMGAQVMMADTTEEAARRVVDIL